MTKKHFENAPISAEKFMDELRRYKKGSVTRRHFLGVTGLGAAMAVMAASVPGLAPRNAHAAGDLGNKLVFSTWPNYHNPVNIENFTETTGVNIQINAFGSNEEMLAKLQAGGTDRMRRCWRNCKPAGRVGMYSCPPTTRYPTMWRSI